jgi:hypothetical protein
MPYNYRREEQELDEGRRDFEGRRKSREEVYGKKDILPRTEQELDDKLTHIYRQMVSIQMSTEEWYRLYGWMECLRWMLNRGDLTDQREEWKRGRGGGRTELPGDRSGSSSDRSEGKRYLIDKSNLTSDG